MILVSIGYLLKEDGSRATETSPKESRINSQDPEAE
jgi:hypothetical protein